MINIQSLAELIDEYMRLGGTELLKYAFLSSMAIAFAVSAVFFLLRGVGLYRLNKRLGNKGAFLAFIPGFSGYALGAAADGLKKRKPSNYCIHMLMLGLFRSILTAISYIYMGGRFVFLYEKLLEGGEIDTVALLTRVFSVGRDEQLFYLVTFALPILEYVVVFVSILCYLRILQLYRRGGFFIVMCSLLVPQVMDVYLFAVRNNPIYVNPPVFRMPDGTTFGPGFDDRNEDGYDDRDDGRYDDEKYDDGSSYGDVPRDVEPSDGDTDGCGDNDSENESNNDSDSDNKSSNDGTDGGEDESRP